MEAIFNWITDKLDYILAAVLVMLPDSPFIMLEKSSEINAVLGFVNWVVPLSEMVAILQLWIVAITVFYVYQLILRWAKAIE